MKNLVLFNCLFLFVQYSIAQTPFLPVFQSDSSWVFIDQAGKEVLKPKLSVSNYDIFYEGMAAAQDKKTKKFGYIDAKGKWAIPPIYTFVSPFEGGLAIVGLPCDDSCYKGDEGLMLGEYTKLIDKKGKIVLHDNSQDSRPYARWWFDDTYNRDGILRVVHGLSVGDIKTLMNHKGRMISDRQSMCCLEVSDGWVAHTSYSGHYYTDKDDKKTLDASKYAAISSFSGGYAWVSDTLENHILIDKEGKSIVVLGNDKYMLTAAVGEGVFSAYSNDKWQYYATNGKMVFNKNFNAADVFSNGLAHILDENFENHYINTKGENVITLKNSSTDWIYGAFKNKYYAIIERPRDDSKINEIIGFVLRDGSVFLKYPY